MKQMHQSWLPETAALRSSRTFSAQEDAVRTAINNACGEMASSVTESMACTRLEPSNLTVLQ